MNKRIKGQIKRLADACEQAFQNNPTLWVDQDGDCVFDFPDYGGLPKRIANRLSSDCVDVIQGHVQDCCFRFKGKFRLQTGPLQQVLEEYRESGYILPY